MDNLPNLPQPYEWVLTSGGLNYLSLRLKKQIMIFGRPVRIQRAKLFVPIDDRTESNMLIAANRIMSKVGLTGTDS